MKIDKGTLPVILVIVFVSLVGLFWWWSERQKKKLNLNPGENSICPVMKKPIYGTPHVAEYEGKPVNLCCQWCVEEFNKNPGSYMT